MLWRRTFGGRPATARSRAATGSSASPAIDKAAGRVYVVGDAGDLRTLSLADGTDAAAALPLVTGPATNKVWGGLTLIGGDLYVATASDGCDSPPWRGVRHPRRRLRGRAARRREVGRRRRDRRAQWRRRDLGLRRRGGRPVDRPRVRHARRRLHRGLRRTPTGIVASTAGLGVLGSFAPDHPQRPRAPARPATSTSAPRRWSSRPTGCPTMLAAGNKDGNLYLIDAADPRGRRAPRADPRAQPEERLAGLGRRGRRARLLAGRPHARSSPTPGPAWRRSRAGVVGLHVKARLQPRGGLEPRARRRDAARTRPRRSPTASSRRRGQRRAGAAPTTRRPAASCGGRPAGGATYAAPIVAGGRVFAGSWDGFTAGAAGTVRAFRPAPAPPPPPPGDGAPGLGDACRPRSTATRAAWPRPSRPPPRRRGR